MPSTVEGLVEGLTLIAFDKTGLPAPSARFANILYASWFLNNLCAHPVQLVFPNARLFDMKLRKADGTVVWISPAPNPAADYSISIDPGGRFCIPINPLPPNVPLQDSSVPLAKIVSDKNIALAEDLELVITVPIMNHTYETVARLWR